MNQESSAIDALGYEQRKFLPSAEFKAAAIISDQSLYHEGERDFAE